MTSTRDAKTRARESLNMRLVEAHDLQARSVYQPVIHQQGERWTAYVGFFIRAVSANTGLHIVELTGGPARAIR